MQQHQQKGNGNNMFPPYNLSATAAQQPYSSTGVPVSQNVTHGFSYGPLSAQNLMFLPANVNQFPMVPSSNLPGQKIPTKNEEENRTKYHKDRQLEQQRHKLQAIGGSGGIHGRQIAQSQRDAMIAQIIGPLPGARHSDGVTSHQPPTTDKISSPLVQESLTQSNNRQLINTNKNYNLSSSSVQLTPQDLERVMSRYYDFTTDPKAQGFVKSANTLGSMAAAPASASSHVFTSDPNAAQWSYSKATNLEGVFVLPSNLPTVSYPPQCGPPPVATNFPTWKPFPVWLTDLSKIPKEYVKYFHSCIPPNRFEEIPDTGLVYILLRASGLSNDALGSIWSLVNRTQPGQLTKVEFFAALALVGFVQKYNKIPTLDALDEMKMPLIPSFGAKIENVLNSQTFLVSSSQTTIPDPRSVLVSETSKKDDEFADFTDFQAASSTLTNSSSFPTQNSLLAPSAEIGAQNNKISEVIFDGNKRGSISSHDIAAGNQLDPYAALREIAGDHIVAADKQSSTIPTSISENNFVFRKTTNELNADYQIVNDVATKSRAEKLLIVSEPDQPMTTGVANFVAHNFSHDPSSSSAAFAEFDNDIATKFAFGQTASVSFDSPDSCSLHSKEPSLHSLDLKSVLTVDSNEEIKEVDNDLTLTPQMTKSSSVHPTDNGFSSSPATLFDRYAAVRETGSRSSEEKLIEAWTKVLEVCSQLLQQACDHFSKASTTSVCKDVLNSERGANYLKSLIEIFRVAKRLKMSLKTNAFQTVHIVNLLADVEAAWETLFTFVGFSELMIKQNEAFSKEIEAVVNNGEQQQQQQQVDVCGVCLLNDICEGKNDDLRGSSKIIVYSGRRYHSQCANLWVNCVESLLPALQVPNNLL